VEDWAEIRTPHRVEGLAVRAIARILGASRNTVRAAIVSDAPPSPVEATSVAAAQSLGCQLWRPSFDHLSLSCHRYLASPGGRRGIGWHHQVRLQS
jgi:hypothetical protein